jgi:hypothetical protein
MASPEEASSSSGGSTSSGKVRPPLLTCFLRARGSLDCGAPLPTMMTKAMLRKKCWLRRHHLLPPRPLTPVGRAWGMRPRCPEVGGRCCLDATCVVRLLRQRFWFPVQFSWLHGRCCRCLVVGHRAANCRDSFRCSRCFENGHRARGCCNACCPLSFLSSLTAPELSHLANKFCVPPAPSHVQREAMLPSSWASVVSATAGLRAPADVALQSIFQAHTELLHSELQDLASSQLKEAIRPMREVADSLRGWLLRVEGFMERTSSCFGCGVKPSVTAYG